MKVLSLLQPWASLAVLGYKGFETRSWNTKHRGELLIHASAGKAYKKLKDSDPLFKHYFGLMRHGLPPIEKLPLGAIIGKVNLLGTARTEHFDSPMVCFELGYKINPLSEMERAFGDYTPGRYGWLLSDPVMFEKPIPAKGQLSIWNFDIEAHSDKEELEWYNEESGYNKRIAK